jgi:hypothetical protein
MLPRRSSTCPATESATPRSSPSGSEGSVSSHHRGRLPIGQGALDSAALTLPDVDALAPRMLCIDEHRYRSCDSSVFRPLRPGNAMNPRRPPSLLWAHVRSWGSSTAVSEGVGDWCSPGRWSGAWACRSSRSTPGPCSGRRCGCDFRAPQSRWTHFIWPNLATTS